MAIQLDFSNAEEQRLRITQEQQEYIRDLYRQASAEVGKLAEQAPRVPSDALRQQYLRTLQKQIDEQLRDIEKQLNGTIRSGMTDTVKATVTDAKAFLKENGLTIKGAYSHVPADIVRSVASGQLYTGNWTLSRALWLNTAETQHDVQSVIAQGIIQNKSAYDIAKDLEKYVNPDARKDWDWGKVYPGTKKVVDYNAQRLARTMVSHAYQQAFVRTTQKNPFVSKYKWEASNSGRVCEICEERDGKLFDKDELPLDHPNGMCTFTAVMDDLEKIGERLGDWAAGKDDPELDKWAEDLYGKGWEHRRREANYTEKEKEALTTYTRHAYSGINTYLRGREDFGTPEIKEIVTQIDSAMKKSVLDHEITVFRGASIEDLKIFNPNVKPSWFEVSQHLYALEGKTATFDSYLSTSEGSLQKQFSKGLEWTFIAEPGVHAIDMRDLSVQRKENEILFDRGTKIEIISMDIPTDEEGYINGLIKIVAYLKR